jgi:MFS family permease
MPEQPPADGGAGAYRWVVLSNTTLGVLLATINASVILISLPAVFRGIGLDPLAPSNGSVFLWMTMGYTLATAALVVSAGRISDMFGRVRMYNLGFAVFTVGSILLFVTPGSGSAAALQMIVYRTIQGIGSAFLFSNSAALLTDAFPRQQRGFALGLNAVAAVAGSLLGVLVGGALATIHWRLVFLVSVPVGLLGTAWAYLKLREIAPLREGQRLDIAGNVTFAGALVLILLGVTQALSPYGGSALGWGNPAVLAQIVGGVVLLGIFVAVELRAEDPMFTVALFRIRPFAAGNLSLILHSIARGGLQFMLIIWLQGVWLPLHGVRFADTPLLAGLCTVPMMVLFLVCGALCGWLSDRFGARIFATGGMLLVALAFVLLLMLPVDFDYVPFAVVVAMLGAGMGMFASPNTTAIMNSVPPEQRSASSGMRVTFMTVGMTLSMGVFFTLVVAGMAGSLPGTLEHALTAQGVPHAAAVHASQVPPTSALFAAYLGYDPVQVLVPPATMQTLAPHTQQVLLGNHFFPDAVGPAFLSGLHAAFAFGAVLSVLSAGASMLRGRATPVPALLSAPLADELVEAAGA